MEKIKKWIHKPKKKVQNLLMIDALTSEKTQHDSPVVMETLTPPLPFLLDIRFILEEDVKVSDDQTCPAGGGASTPGSCDVISPGFPVHLFKERSYDLSLPSSPHTGKGRRTRLPSSLPCSPLLGGRSAPPSPSVLSRLLVEAALRRSKNIQQTRCSPQVREGVEVERSGSKREGAETGQKGEWSDDEEEEDQQQKTEDDVGTRLSNNVIFRSPMSPKRWKREEKGEGEGGDPDFLYSDYCLLTPCVCSRCPSAPPYEANVSSFPPEDQNAALIGWSPGTDGRRTGQEQSSPVEGVPQPGHSSRLYPSLSLWRITAEPQTKANGKQEVNNQQLDRNTTPSTTHSCLHGNVTDDHLEQLQGASERPVELCSFCSDELTIMKHVCRSCRQVFCCCCLSHFISLLQIHQFRPTAEGDSEATCLTQVSPSCHLINRSDCNE